MIFERIIQGYLILQDRIRGTDFHRKVIEHVGGGYYYECTHLRILPQLRRICSKVTPKDCIIDVGCGKGRMLAWFSQFAFGRVDGIELNSSLVSIAEKNMAKLGLSSKIIFGDVRTYQEWDPYNYFYLYNPFPEKIMEEFIHNLKESIRRNPRTVYVLYTNAECRDTLIASGFRELPLKRTFPEKIWRLWLSELTMYSYETGGAGE